jgi:Fe-S-cluster containining protein
MSHRVALKQQLLKALYEAYDEAASDFFSACLRECSVCCTHNVVGTTLEAAIVIERLEEQGREYAVHAVAASQDVRRLRPALSINALAACCLQRTEPPPEDTDADSAPCPIRGAGGCLCYEVRPLACRSQWSEELCVPGGEAIMDPALVTLNGVFQQMAEHIDAGGLYGNLSDLILAFRSPEVRSAYWAGSRLPSLPHLHPAIPSPGLLVPPHHRNTISRALSCLWEKKVGDVTFRQAMLGSGSLAG